MPAGGQPGKRTVSGRVFSDPHSMHAETVGIYFVCGATEGIGWCKHFLCASEGFEEIMVYTTYLPTGLQLPV